MSSEKDESAERQGLLPRFTLKHADTFLLADALGDIQSSSDGLYSNDTRVLSRYELQIANRRPSLLGAAISQDNTLFTAHLTNRPLPMLGEEAIPKGVIHIERCRLLADNGVHECLCLTNFSNQRAQVPVRLCFAADFADIFEVQGFVRHRRGERLAPVVGKRTVRLAYRGRDGRERVTHLSFSQQPEALEADEARFLIELHSGQRSEFFIEIGTAEESAPSRNRYKQALETAAANMGRCLETSARISTSGRLFNEWIDRSESDLALLVTTLPTGPYPYAGIPWFATQFGRDGIITALQTLWAQPLLAAGVLRFLASTQARETSTFRDSEPGKIMHETRRGEMAALGEVPFACYYGGVDSTPLFVMLAGAYERQTGDRALADEIWDHLLAATKWIERRLDKSPTGFLDYARGEKSGLANQAWKDSQDSIFHEDGSDPEGPIAVVEVQGYAFAAFEAMADLATARGQAEQSARWKQRAQDLQIAIERSFWMPDLNFYAIALDGKGQQCRVRASNAGHLLYCGVPNRERGMAVADQLMGAPFRSGWGIRTLAEGQHRFNPMSYHNGSVWPHDTALCAAGIARYRGTAQVAQVIGEMFEAAARFSMRLPELYCGFTRAPGLGPVPYPVACLPQAWAAGSVFMLLQTCLGIRVDGRQRELHVSSPQLPIGIESLTIRALPVADVRIDLEFHRVGGEVVILPAKHGKNGVAVFAHL
jgi:glycogen debranching enzyme